MIVTALVACYNEADILRAMLRHWTTRGMAVFLLDNWSTDGSFEIAQSEPGVMVERWPSHPLATFEWGALLDTFQARLADIQTDWFSLSGADHFLDVPADGSLGPDVVQAIETVDRQGYTAIEMIHRNYVPMDDSFTVGDPVAALCGDYYDNAGFLCDTWKKLPGITPVLRNQGGHDIDWPGRKVFPQKFIRRHYPIRSQAHGERKVFLERIPRWSPQERALGWHVQYDDLQPGHRFTP